MSTTINRKKRKRNEQKKVLIFLGILIFILIGMLLFLLFGNPFGGRNKGTANKNEESMKASEESDTNWTDTYELATEETLTEATENEPSKEEKLAEKVEEKLAQMTTEEKVAQLFVVTPEALTGAGQVTAAGDTTRSAYKMRPVGGIIYMENNLVDAEQTKKMLSNMNQISQDVTGLCAFLTVDEEGGTVARVANNGAFSVKNVGNMRDIGTTGNTDNAYQAGVTIGSYLSDLGFNVDFAPDADVITNSENQVVKYRSFGTDAVLVADMVTAELTGMEECGVYGVIKHFPGHGATASDTHKGYAYTNKSIEEMKAEELVPFQAGIDAGVSFVMVGHISAPNVTGDNTPASMSKTMVTDILRNQMGYDGIVITDAMNMGAISNDYSSGKAAVLAINAGVDMILMPADFADAYAGVLNAVSDGTISIDTIDASVRRILRVKIV